MNQGDVCWYTFRPPDKRETMQVNLRNIFQRMTLTQQDIQTLYGVVMAIADGRKGPARGGILDGAEAEMLRALLAEHGQGRVPDERGPVRGPVRGLARLLRRNPTDAERAFWDALMKDRRFAGWRFQRQVPIGRHIPDIVSFPLRLAIELVPPDEGQAAKTARAERRVWLEARNYRVVDLATAAIERDMERALEQLRAAIEAGG